MTQGDPRALSGKLLRQRSFVIGASIVLIALFIAVAGYWISADSSPDANRMIVEIANRPPGFTQQFLLVPKTPRMPRKNALQRTISGQPDTAFYIPITSYQIINSTLVARVLVDEGLSSEQTYPLTIFGSDGKSSFDSTRYITKIRFALGTDKFGRDMVSRLVLGTRISLGVGSIAMILSLSIGLLLGMLAGYYGGKCDQGIMWFINVIWSIPTLLLVFAITLLLGKGFWQVFVAVGLTMWVNVARLVRGQLMGIRKLEYVEAARALGYGDIRILLKHILPNILGPVLVVAAANFASAIVVEAGLSFLGIGVQPPQPSWGGMIKENYNFIITNNPMLALAPGFAIMVLVLAFNLIGNGIRDAVDVNTQ